MLDVARFAPNRNFGDEIDRHINDFAQSKPLPGVARGVELLAFDRRVRHHLQHLLVAPDVVLERRDVEIADQNGALSCCWAQ